MLVKVYPYREKIGFGNIIWTPFFPMRGGKFPKEHPCAPGEFADQCGSGENIKSFRERGYWASCFPEGDGIAWKPLNGQSDEQCIKDIGECFGWETKWGAKL